MTRKNIRWWESGERDLQSEAAWFAEEGLDFELDQELFDRSEVVVFRGTLRLGDRTTPASVVYPPSYASGGHPRVVAPDLDLGRHRAPDGTLCLDHPVFGQTSPMYGAEAAVRAQRLWQLWEEDRDRLWQEEADAPDPRANYFTYADDSAITLVDVDVIGAASGFFRLAAEQIAPLRAGVVEVRIAQPELRQLKAGPAIDSFAGPIEINGPWVRLDSAPPPGQTEFIGWLQAHHRGLLDEQVRFAKAQAQVTHRPDMPAVIGFVYPDEGPSRNEIHDAWLFVVIDPRDGSGHLARAFHVRSEDRWLRQPQLRPLEDKAVAVIGTGALGSQVADLLAKAGVGRLFVVDFDIYSVGNRVRHQLDLTDLGRAKASALAIRLLRVNPWCIVETQVFKVGEAGIGPQTEFGQQADDTFLGELASCDLIVNATAHGSSSAHISGLASLASTPAVHTWVSAGAWGGRVLIQRPGLSGCWRCLGLTQADPSLPAVPRVTEDPSAQQVSERGCADPTFTGPGFELTSAASATARACVQLLLDGSGGYPSADFDLLTLSFRDETAAVPTAVQSKLPIHPDCSTCERRS